MSIEKAYESARKHLQAFRVLRQSIFLPAIWVQQKRVVETTATDPANRGSLEPSRGKTGTDRMPIRETGLYTYNVGPEAELREALIEELRNPKEEGEPLIAIDRPRPSTIHVYGIWSRWGELDQSIRSRIILDAFETARGDEEMDQVSVSMGLTQEEADRLGLEY